MALIYIVEDDLNIREIESIALKNSNYTVSAFDCAEAFFGQMAELLPDLVILDIMLPDQDGYEIMRKMRKNPLTAKIPIIIVTAKTTEMDLVKSLDSGADDYIRKPFSIMELLSRVRALLRRSMNGNQAAQSRQRTPLLTVGDLSLDTEQRVALRDGKTIDLTAKEYDLIELLMKNPRRVYSRESLMDLVWGYSYAGDYRTVDVHIRRLREKLEPDPANPVYIMTKWGVGYYFKGEEQPTV